MAWSRTSRHSRGYGTQWDRLRKRILERDDYLCQPCLEQGFASSASQVDHITPKAKGGTDSEDNLQSICTACHKDKTTRENGGRVRLAIGADGWPV